MAFINGTTGNDTLNGTVDADYIDGDDGNDSIFGDAGNDNIDGGDGDDTLRGGDNDDTIYDIYGTNLFDGGAGNDILNSEGVGSQTFVGGSGQDTIYAGESSTITGGGDADTFFLVTAGTALAPLIITDFEDGTDVIDMSLFDGQIAGIYNLNGTTFAQDGADVRITFTNGDVLLLQNELAADIDMNDFANVINISQNVVNGTSSNDTLVGSAGADLITALSGDDSISAGAGDDVIDDSNGNDTIDAGAGHDIIDDSWGDDSIIGGTGNDYINGGYGRDTIDAGDGNDTVISSWGRDVIDLGAGDDYFESSWDGGSIALGTGNDIAKGGNGAENYAIELNAGDVDLIRNFRFDALNNSAKDYVDLTAIESISGFSDLSISTVLAGTDVDMGNGTIITLDENAARIELDGGQLLYLEGSGAVHVDASSFNFYQPPAPVTAWQKQYGLDGAGEFQYVDTDGNGVVELHAFYGDTLWKFEAGNGWEAQLFAAGADRFQWVDLNADGDMEFAGLYNGALWISDYGDGGWEYTYLTGIEDFQYANNDADANMELFLEYANGDIWEFDPGDSGWSLLYQYQGVNIVDWQIMDIDNDGTVDYTYSGDGQVQTFEPGQGWTNFPQLTVPDNYQFVDTNGDGINEFLGTYGAEMWQYNFPV